MSSAHQSIVVRRVSEPADWHAANQLVSEYLEWLDDSLGSTIVRKAGIGHADRLGVEVSFASPNQFYVASAAGDMIVWAAAAAFFKVASSRLVPITARAASAASSGVSERLVRAVIAGVRNSGHSHLRLETHRPTMPVAYDLYRRLGFEERRGGIDIDGAVQMILPLCAEATVP
jgi:hypothetical protein